ncbi:MAG TPA: ParB/RepB/Spo0J family partition protein [Bdellovibrionota bacterium]|nr:ParB/RepB/Spo0J family partition protein [Bdellovibrionota bacterium]
MAQKQVLGKGLASLFPGVAPMGVPGSIPQGPPPAGATVAGPATTVLSQPEMGARIPGISLASVEDIQVNQYQPRRDFDDRTLDDLAQSIRSNGIIQPLVVRKTALGSYELIAGERRLRAAKLAGLKQVPVVIRRSTDREALEMALIENIQRQDLNCIDEALAYFQLIQDFSLTQEEAAARLGKDRATVANHLRLLRLPEAIIDDLKRQILSFGHGKALLGLEDNDARLRARAQAVEFKLSVRETEALVEKLKREAEASAAATAIPAATVPQSPVLSRLQSIAQELTRHWSRKVELKGSERRGKIVFHYSSREDLDRLLEAMQNHKV